MVHTSSDRNNTVSSRKEKSACPTPNKQKIACDIVESIEDHITSLDRNGKVIYINGAAANDLGFEPNQLTGKNFWKMFPKLVGTLLEKNCKEAIDKREIRRFEWKTIYSKSAFKEFNVFPATYGATVFSKDITKRKIAEEELKKNQEILNNIVNSTDSVIIARDLNERLILLNKAESKIYKMPVEQALGTTPYDIYPKEVAEEIMAWDKRVFAEGKSFRYEESIALDGKKRTFVTNKFPLRDLEGNIYGLGGVITDITDRKEMETKLEQYTKNLEELVHKKTMELQEKERLAAIGETAGMVGHDIRNPLQSMVGDLYLLDCEIAALPHSDSKKNMQESIVSIQANVEYIDKIVEDLKNYSRTLQPNLKQISLEKVIEEVFLITPIPCNLQVKIEIENHFPQVFADFSMLKRALINLVQNAVQAMPDGGKLTLTAKCIGNQAVISVEDTGTGIPDELKPKLFQPMVTTKAKGQGLGLAVVKRLVEAQGGAISFQSQVGSGTQFSVNMPIKNTS